MAPFQWSESKQNFPECPLFWLVFGAVDVVRSDRKIVMVALRSPGVKSEGYITLNTLRKLVSTSHSKQVSHIPGGLPLHCVQPAQHASQPPHEF